MNISQREKNIVIAASLVAAIFFIYTGMPYITDHYDTRNELIEDQRVQIRREQRLIQDTVVWRDRRVGTEAKLTELESEIFSGQTIPIAEANIQRALTLHARESDISVSSTRLAERLSTSGWLLISQEMSFRTDDQRNLIGFLAKLESSVPRLRVTDFSFTRNRNQYSGSITVVGFVKSDGMQTASADTGRRR